MTWSVPVEVVLSRDGKVRSQGQVVGEWGPGGWMAAHGWWARLWHVECDQYVSAHTQRVLRTKIRGALSE